METTQGCMLQKNSFSKVAVKLEAREKINIMMYEGSLDDEKLFDWIRSMEKYFNYEDVDEEKKVKHVVTRLKVHAALWWDELQADRRCKGKKNIKNQYIMVAKLKAKFIPKDYQINLFKML
jgi:hypothetical protein